MTDEGHAAVVRRSIKDALQAQDDLRALAARLTRPLSEADRQEWQGLHKRRDEAEAAMLNNLQQYPYGQVVD